MPSPRIVHVSRRLIGFVLVLTLKVDWVTYRLLLLENKDPEGLGKKTSKYGLNGSVVYDEKIAGPVIFCTYPYRL